MKIDRFGNYYWELGLASWLAISGAIASSFDFATAQITPDNTLGAENSIVTPGVNINGIESDRIYGGAIREANLFHSFGEFNVSEGRGAYFTNPAGIENILSRVTGNDPSDILGKLGVLGNANLFLINPNGIIFGPSSSMDLGGSFLASTASSLNFADGTQFSATASQTTPLLTVSVPIGLQFGGNPGSILNQSRATNTSGELVGLQVQPGKNLVLVGGNVSLDGGILQATGGRVELGGLAGTGTVGLNFDNNNNLQLSFPNGVVRADVSLTNGAGVNVVAGGGGSIAINAQSLDVLGGSFLLAGIGENLGSIDSQAGDITLNATGTIRVARSSINNAVQSRAVGNAGNLSIEAKSLNVSDRAQVGTLILALGKGNAGDLTVRAYDSMEVSKGTTLGAQVNRGATGNGGNLTIETGHLVVRDGAQVSASTFGVGNSGDLTIRASDSVLLSGVFGLFAQVNRGATGNGGNLTIETGRLIVRDGAQVSASTFGAGNSGDLTVRASDLVKVIREGSPGFPSGLFAQVNQPAIGNGGNLTLETGRLIVGDGAQVSASTFGAGNSGDLTVRASKVELIGRTANNTSSSGLFAQVNRGATGNGGNLTIKTGRLIVRDGARASVGTSGQGEGGTLVVNALESLEVIGTSADGKIPSTLVTSTQGTGAAGDLTVNTGKLIVRDGAQISASTFGKGKGGTLKVTAPKSVEVSGTSANGQLSSGLFASTAGAGAAGDLKIETGQLTVRDRAKVTVSSEGAGKAGNLEATARSVRLDNNGSLTATTRSGNGGNIKLQVQDLLQLRRKSQISATAGTDQAGGDGGNIDIDAGFIVALEDSDITANAFEGRGGNVQITTQGLFLSPDSQITASSERGINGVVEIRTPDVEVQNSLTELSGNFVSPEQVVAGSCLARRNVERGIFTVTGTGGLPQSPYAAMSGRYSVTGVQPLLGSNHVTSRPAVVETAPWKRGDPIQEAQGMAVTADGLTIIGTAPEIVDLAKAQNLICLSD